MMDGVIFELEFILIRLKRMIHCFFLISRHGRSRLTKWYSSNMSQMEKQRFLKEVKAGGCR